MSNEQLMVKDSVKEISEIYDIPISKMNEAQIQNEYVAVLTHLVNQNENILFAGLFGSRINRDKNAHDESDIDIAVILQDYSEDRMSDISFEINRKMKRKFGFEIDMDIVAMNSEVDHGNSEIENDRMFRESAKSDMLVLKGDLSIVP